MSKHSEIILFFREVHRIISKHGLSQVLNHLRMINTDFEVMEIDVLKYIVSLTAIHFEISKDELLNSNKRGIITEARRMCFALIKENLPFSDEQIGEYFGGRSRQYVNKELGSLPVNRDYYKNKQEKKFVTDFIELSKKVIEYKNQYKVIP